MKIVKVSSSNPALSQLLLRQSPGGKGIWGGCKFVVNQALDECDWWIVCHVSGLKDNEKTKCNSKNTVYISMEPEESIVKTHNDFLSQFEKIVLVDRSIKHKNIIKSI